MRSSDSSFLIFPVRGDPLLGNQIHVARPYLHFERLTAFGHDRRVQRLIEVRLRHGDVVLDPSGNGPPHLMNDAETCVAIAERGSGDAEGEIVVKLTDVDLLFLELHPDRVHRLHASVDLAFDLVVFQLSRKGRFDAVDDFA